MIIIKSFQLKRNIYFLFKILFILWDKVVKDAKLIMRMFLIKLMH